MALLEKQLMVKRSGLPGAGKGLFTKKFIPKGARIVEYKGRITTWKDVNHDEGRNGYIYYVKRNHVIDARPYKKALAKYANDARGIGRTRGMGNNAAYIEDGDRVYIEAVKDIAGGAEILVNYGKEYWEVIKYNLTLHKKEEKNRS